MFYIYLLRSEADSGQTYVGYTEDLKKRLREHNEGMSLHTAKFRPWKIVSYCAFDDEEKALSFEKYLKSGSGRAFARRRLW